MKDAVFAVPGAGTPIRLFTQAKWQSTVTSQSPAVLATADRTGFKGKSGQLAQVVGPDGSLEELLFGVGASVMPTTMGLRTLAASAPAGDYHLVDGHVGLDATQIALAWALGRYRFDRYKQAPGLSHARLAPPSGADVDLALSLAGACTLARDMINTPANDMGPQEIQAIAEDMAQRHGAQISVVIGDDLLAAGYPVIHAVGRAAVAHRAPRMIEMTWGKVDHPRVALVGKGVVFDTGGLDLKPSSGMRWMKKDMGGAAHVLGLASMIMQAELPVSLSVLLPVVENAVAGDAMRPGDILPSRKGLTIEIGNTDAEGRLILADALTRAAELNPDLTIDLATLTGAARVALGPDVVPFYTDDEALAAALGRAAVTCEDPMWRMPMWPGYAASLDSDVADVKNDPDAWAQAGSITAALFLQKFAPEGAWVHFDIYAWNTRSRPGFPQGAEAQAIRAVFSVLRDRYS